MLAFSTVIIRVILTFVKDTFPSGTFNENQLEFPQIGILFGCYCTHLHEVRIVDICLGLLPVTILGSQVPMDQSLIIIYNL